MEARLGEILKGLDVMFGTHSELNYVRGHSATINTPEKIQFLQEIGKTYVGEEHLTQPQYPSMCAEDFSSYLENFPAPSCGSVPANRAHRPFTMQAFHR